MCLYALENIVSGERDVAYTPILGYTESQGGGHMAFITNIRQRETNVGEFNRQQHFGEPGSTAYAQERLNVSGPNESFPQVKISQIGPSSAQQ